MNTQEMRDGVKAEIARLTSLLPALELAAAHKANEGQMKRLAAQVEQFQDTVANLKTEIASLQAKKGAVTRELAARIVSAEDEFAKSLDTRRALRDEESAKDDTKLVARKTLHEGKMQEFDDREKRASGLAKKAEDWLERMRAKLAV